MIIVIDLSFRIQKIFVRNDPVQQVVDIHLIKETPGKRLAVRVSTSALQ